jgi:hypothetical protein
MSGTIGCATIVAAVAFILGLVGALFAHEASVAERFMNAGIMAAMAFCGVLILGTRDLVRYKATIRADRRKLLAQENVTDAEFLSHFSDVDPALILQIRLAVAALFQVPAEKVHPSDSLQDDLRLNILEPGFHSFVVAHVLKARNVAPQPYVFHSVALKGFNDLVKELQRILDGMNSERTDDT